MISVVQLPAFARALGNVSVPLAFFTNRNINKGEAI